ncbi:MAG: Hpt domain-containing protein [Oscillospiraceae bacterium]
MSDNMDSILSALEKELPEMDIATGMMYCIDDKEFFVSMIQEYISGDRLQKLKEAYAASDWDNYKITAHSSKSTSRTIGLTALSEMFLGLETAAKSGDIAYIHANHSAAVNELERVLNVLTAIVPPEQ